MENWQTGKPSDSCSGAVIRAYGAIPIWHALITRASTRRAPAEIRVVRTLLRQTAAISHATRAGEAQISLLHAHARHLYRRNATTAASAASQCITGFHMFFTSGLFPPIWLIGGKVVAAALACRRPLGQLATWTAVYGLCRRLSGELCVSLVFFFI